jgi:hypothetical protein
LLNQIAQNEEASEAEWQAIGERLKQIANMKQSLLGHAWEFITYGQGSLPEKQAIAMMMLAGELAAKYGYRNVRTWSEVLHGQFGHFEKER